MTPNPISVGPKTSFADAIGIMADKGIGNLVVKEDHVIRGIFTEREILQYIVLDKKIPNNKPMRDIVVRPYTSISLETIVLNAAKIMIEEKARLLVLDNKKLVGIITASDMLRGFRKTGFNPSLENVISKKIYKCLYDDSVFTAAKVMHQKRIGSVIIEKDKIPYGIFTERDLLVNVLSNDVDLKSKVGGYCSRPLITAEIGICGNGAAKLMASKKIKRLALTKGDKIVGIVTARDIVDVFHGE